MRTQPRYQWIRAASTLLLVQTTLGWIQTSPLTVRHHDATTRTTRLLDLVTTLDGEVIRGPITPLGNFVLVKVKDTLQATTGGILLPDQAKERPTEGLVMEAGPGKIHPHTGVRITNPVQAGLSVLYGKFDGKAIEYKGDECQMIRDDDIMLYYQGVTMSLDNVVPSRDYVLVEVPQDENLQTSSGVVISSMVTKGNEVCEGTVVKVGEGRMASDGSFTPSPVQPGDFVKFKDYAGNEVRIDGKEFMLVRMVEILATQAAAGGAAQVEP